MDELTKERFKTIRLLATDFDGVMTDGYVYVDQNGKETVRCSRKDGLGIAMLKKAGIDVVVLSKEINPVVEIRCKKLDIPCYQKIYDSEGKLDILKRIMLEKNITQEGVAYMGDDLNDKKAYSAAGVRIAVSDAHSTIKEICNYVCRAKGGEHAVREVSELILEAKNIIANF